MQYAMVTTFGCETRIGLGYRGGDRRVPGEHSEERGQKSEITKTAQSSIVGLFEAGALRISSPFARRNFRKMEGDLVFEVSQQVGIM
jgi:hypothetical protein